MTVINRITIGSDCEAGSGNGNRSGYLTDSELEALIAAAEREGVVPAPPDLGERIISLLESEDGSGGEQTADANREPAEDTAREAVSVPDSYERRMAEFRRFRRQVIISIAASVAILIAVQMMPGEVQREIDAAMYRVSERVLEAPPPDDSVFSERGERPNYLFGGARSGIFADDRDSAEND